MNTIAGACDTTAKKSLKFVSFFSFSFYRTCEMRALDCLRANGK